MAEDKTLKCRDCGQDYVFTVGEQQFYAEKGFANEPTRCQPCRQARKRERTMSGGGGAGGAGGGFGRDRY